MRCLHAALSAKSGRFEPAYAALRTVRLCFSLPLLCRFLFFRRLLALRADDAGAEPPEARRHRFAIQLARSASMMSITFALAGAPAPSGIVISSPSTFF